jgi:hypothetical protein
LADEVSVSVIRRLDDAPFVADAGNAGADSRIGAVKASVLRVNAKSAAGTGLVSAGRVEA